MTPRRWCALRLAFIGLPLAVAVVAIVLTGIVVEVAAWALGGAL